MFYARKPKKPLNRSNRKTVKTNKKKPIATNIKNYIQKVISVKAENKITSFSASINFSGIAQSNSLNALPLTPYVGYLTLGQGVGQGQRIGNEVKVKKLHFNYSIVALPYNAVSNISPQPFIVKMTIGNVKQYQGVTPDAGDVYILYQLGSTTLPPTSTISDLLLDYNKDDWNIKKSWTHKIGYSSVSGTGSNAVNQYFANNDFNFNAIRKLDLTSMCNKTLKFNDALNTTSGAGLFVMMEAIPVIGGSFSLTQLVANITYNIIIEYEDL